MAKKSKDQLVNEEETSQERAFVDQLEKETGWPKEPPKKKTPAEDEEDRLRKLIPDRFLRY